MLPLKQHDSRVVYVARSTREFPDTVREWLSHADHRAIASANVYDALARLTGRRRPVALIVSIESVDWEELDFFDLAARLSPDTSIYITGHEHNGDKIEAALSRGARPFSADELNEDLARPAPISHPPTTRDLLAGTLPRVHDRPNSPVGVGSGRDFRVAATSAPSLAAKSPAPTTIQVEQPDPDRKESQTVPAEGRVTPPPTMRLAPSSETESDLERSAEPELAIPFPWAPSPARPKRTPPAAESKPAAEARDTQEAPLGSKTETTELPSEPSVSHLKTPPSVELTSEELAALMGQPVPPRSGSEQEQRS